MEKKKRDRNRATMEWKHIEKAMKKFEMTLPELAETLKISTRALMLIKEGKNPVSLYIQTFINAGNALVNIKNAIEGKDLSPDIKKAISENTEAFLDMDTKTLSE